MRLLEMNEAEFQKLLNIMDAGVRSTGMQCAVDCTMLLGKVVSIPESPETQAEEPVEENEE